MGNQKGVVKHPHFLIFFKKPIDKSKKVWYNKDTIKKREVITNGKNYNHRAGTS
jgi:hypothetical protein